MDSESGRRRGTNSGSESLKPKWSRLRLNSALNQTRDFAPGHNMLRIIAELREKVDASFAQFVSKGTKLRKRKN